MLGGDTWIRVEVPTTRVAEFHSQEFGGLTYRVAVLRSETAGAGEMVLALADGSDARQQWAQQLLLRVLLPSIQALERFLDYLTRLPGVANIRSSFALKQVRYKTALPLPSNGLTIGE